MSSPGKNRAQTALLLAVLLVGGSSRSVALAQTPPLPSADPIAPAPAGPTGNDSVAERLQKLEELNKKLLDRVEKLSDENQQLSKEVKDLSTKVKESSGKDEKSGDGEKDQDKKEGKKASGLAGPWPIADEEDVKSAYEEAARSSGLNHLPNSQIRGNRRLGRIPLHAFYDYGRDGVGFTTDDDEFLLKFRGELQADIRDYLGATQYPTHSGFYIPRVRYYFQGTFTKPIAYQLSFQRSFSSFSFLNVFLNFNYDKRLQVRVGRFKVPYTYEWYKLNNWRLITPERSLFVENFGLNRMVGVMGWGSFSNDRLEYAVGMFDGPRNSFQDYNASKDVVAFLNLRPFLGSRSFLENLNFGGSLDYGIQDNPINPAVLRTNTNASSTGLNADDPINNATAPFLAFNDNVTEKGLRQLYELHLAYYYKGFSMYSGWDSGRDSFAMTNQRPVSIPVEGYSVTMAYLITGETLRERTLIDPIKRFDLRPGKFGLGAFEPFVRYSDLSLSQDVFKAGLADPNLWTNHASLVDVGMNWYLNQAVKVYFDWEHAIFGQPVMFQPNHFRSTNDLLWLRFQLYF